MPGDAALLVTPVILPLAGAAAALLLRTRPRAVALLGIAVQALLLPVALALLARATDERVLAVTVFGGWPQGIGVGFAARLPGAALVVVASLIALAAAIYALATIGPRRRRAGYDALVLAMLAAVNGAFLTTDLFNLYVWFELALVAALGLVTIDRRRGQIAGAVRYATFGMTAATAILAGIGILYGVAGTLDLAALATMLRSQPPSVATATALALLAGGLAIKSGLVPFHQWLPSSYAAAPVGAAAIFAGLLTKMGFYALLLVVAGLWGLAALAGPIGLVAAATMNLCALSALAQADMRRLLGYHVAGQVGYMAAGLATGTVGGTTAAVFYMIHSMIVQANLYLGIGAIHHATGSWRLERTGGMTRSNPLFAFLFAVPMLSLAGIPPLSGFWAKLLVVRAAIDAGAGWLAAAALVAALLTIMSVAALWSEACWKSLHGRRVRRVPAAMLVAMALLSAATLAIGLMPERVLTVARLSAAALERLGGGA